MRTRINGYAMLATLAMHRLSACNSGGADAAAAAAVAGAPPATPTDSTSNSTSSAPPAAATTTEQKPAADPAQQPPAAAGAPEKYELKLPDGSTLGADFVTRTADIARALGLNNEAGQKLLDAQIAEVTQARTAAVDAGKAEQLEAMKPGGAIWTEQESQWRNQSLADAEIGGSPEKLQANVDLANKVVARFATEETKKFFQDSGLGSHPELVRVFTRIGRQMSEATLVRPGASSGTASTEDERLAKRYPTMAAAKS